MMEIETGIVHTTKASSIGVYHVRRNCLPARRIKPCNTHYGGELGCYGCPKPTMLDPCSMCGP